MNPQVISQAAVLHRYLSVMDWLAFSDTQNMRSHQAVTYSCLGEGRKRKFYVFVLKDHNFKINIKLWEKSKKKKVKCLVTASAMCYLVCFGRADSWCLIPLERAGCFSGSQSSCSANLMKSHSGFIHHLVLFVFSSNSARKRTKGFSTDSLGRCQWSTSRSLCCIYWPHRSPLVPFQLPPVISHFNTALHTGCT